MNFNKCLLLFLTKKFAGNRSIAASYHLLKGKKTSQTIQDGRYFRVSFLFGTLKKIQKQELVHYMGELIEDQFVLEREKDTFIITKKGIEALDSGLSAYPLPKYLNGWEYADLGERFWGRFSLFFQSLSHLLSDNTTFVPVQQGIQVTSWVKTNFPKTTSEREKVASQLYNECEDILSSMEELEATIMVMRLSGHHRVGFTNEQIATTMNLEKDYVTILFQGALHSFLYMLLNNRNKYPLLSTFIEGITEAMMITDSAAQTYKLINNGYTINDIAKARNLKRNTIEDHIVEIAANDPYFSIDSYVPKKIQSTIREVVESTGSKRLKNIKKLIPVDVDYFMIRLVLMQDGGKNEA